MDKFDENNKSKNDILFKSDAISQPITCCVHKTSVFQK